MHWSDPLPPHRKFPILAYSNGFVGGLCRQCRQNLEQSRFLLKDIFGNTIGQMCSVDCANAYRASHQKELEDSVQKVPERRQRHRPVPRVFKSVISVIILSIFVSLVYYLHQ